MSPAQHQRLHGVIQSIYLDAASKVQFAAIFSERLEEALREAGFAIEVRDLTVIERRPQ